LLSLVEISDINDPDVRLRHELEHLDELIRIARGRKRKTRLAEYSDPDGNTVTKALDQAHKLIADAAARRGTDVVSSQSQAQAQQIIQLKAVLLAYEQMPLEQWLEMRARYCR